MMDRGQYGKTQQILSGDEDTFIHLCYCTEATACQWTREDDQLDYVPDIGIAMTHHSPLYY